MHQYHTYTTALLIIKFISSFMLIKTQQHWMKFLGGCIFFCFFCSVEAYFTIHKTWLRKIAAKPSILTAQYKERMSYKKKMKVGRFLKKPFLFKQRNWRETTVNTKLKNQKKKRIKYNSSEITSNWITK